jgi:hypothetical protein
LSSSVILFNKHILDYAQFRKCNLADLLSRSSFLIQRTNEFILKASVGLILSLHLVERNLIVSSYHPDNMALGVRDFDDSNPRPYNKSA